MQTTADSISQRFAECVARHAARVAVSAPAGQWTYAELDRRASFLAAEILDKLGETSEPVALLMEHDAPLIATIFGALKANKIYLALDPNHPAEQLAAILSSSGARLLLADDPNLALANSLASGPLKIFPVTRSGLVDLPARIFPEISGDDGAWLMFTSGSTGGPKGVWQNHRGLVQEADVYAELIGLKPDDRVALLAACGLAASGATLFATLLNGATLCPFHLRTQGVGRLADWLPRENITIFHSVPTVFRHLARAAENKNSFASVRVVRLGGEPVLRGDVEIFRRQCPDDCRFIQSLSSTETGMICTLTMDQQTPLPPGRVAAGFPVRGVEVFLVDENKRPVAAGSEGRIAVRSARLRQGYWRQPELTAENFLPDIQDSSRRIFISNDLGRFLADGSLEHLGRADQMMKIRGQRVDLGEIEAAVLATGLAREAVVIGRKDESGEEHLAAYFVPCAGADVSLQNFRGRLRRQFPEYMIPGDFIPLEKLPQTPGGKIDRRALPSPARPETKLSRARKPRDLVETRLARIWKSVLNVSSVGRADDFFQLGGTSLQSVEVLLRIEELFGVALPPSTLAERSTVEKLAELLTDHVVIPAPTPLVTLREGGVGRPLFLIHSGQGDVTSYGLLARRLTGRPIYGLQSVGLQGESWPLMSIKAMAQCYLREIKDKDSTGPYLLGATCMGGMVAFEIARQLVGEGRKVALLAFFDVNYPLPQNRHPDWIERFYGPWRDRVRDGARMFRWFVIRAAGFGRSPRGRADYRRFVAHMNSRAFRRYRPEFFPGEIKLFNTVNAKFAREDLRLRMRQYAEISQVISIPGDRSTLYVPPAVDELAWQLQNILESVDGSARGLNLHLE
mgnify:CR=1 FL=1